MNNHPISELLTISMTNIRDMIDVDTIIGDAIKIDEEVTLIPISKVKSTFITGGTDQGTKRSVEEAYPFGGATGGTVSIVPIAFISISKKEIKLLHLDESASLLERVIDQVPELIEKIKELTTKEKSGSEK